MSYIERGTATYRKANLALFAAGFVTFSNLYTTQPLLPVLAKQFHTTPTATSLTLSVSTAALAIVMLFAAGLSDAIGRKKMMSISMIVGSMIAFLTAFAPNFGILLVLRTLLGGVFAGVPAIAMGYIGEEFHKRSLGTSMGLYISGNSIGGLFGRLATGALTDWFNWHIALAVIGLLSLAFSFYFTAALPKPVHFKPKHASLKETAEKVIVHFKNPGLVFLFIVPFLLMGGFVTMFNYIGFLLMDPPYSVSQTVIGFIFLVYLMGTFSSAWMGKNADRYGSAHIIKISMVIMLAGVFISLVANLYMIIIGLAVFTFGFFGAHSVASRWVGERAPFNKAQASAIYLLFYYAGSSIVGTFGGVFWSGAGWYGVVLLISVLIIVAGVATLISELLAHREAQ